MKKVVVLGGGVFIGGHLEKKLKEQVFICNIKKAEKNYLAFPSNFLE
jgi:hypothetical protein